MDSHIRERLPRIFRNEVFMLVVVLFVLMAIVGVLTRGLFFTAINIRNMLLGACIVGVAAVGQAFVIISAGIDLSITGVAIFTSCLGAGLMTADPRLALLPGGAHLPMAAGVIIMALVGIGIGAFNGLSVSRLNMSPLIVTIAVWQIAGGGAYQLTQRGKLIMKLPESLSFFGLGNIAGMPAPIIFFMVVVIIGYVVLNHTSFGRAIYASGGSPGTAYLSGIRVKNVQLSAYIISGLCAGLAAILALSRVMCASTSVVIGLELQSIAAVVIGGVSLMGGSGSLIGVLVGVLILGVINNAMNLMDIIAYRQMIIRGAVIIGAVAVDVWRRRK